MQAFDARLRMRDHHCALGQLGKGCGGLPVDRRQRLVPEHEADHRRLLQGELLAGVQAVQSRL